MLKSFARCRQASSPSTCLAYHEISPWDCRYRYSISVPRFKEHVLTIRQLCDSGSLIRSDNYITFDDGHNSQYIDALPILIENDQAAIFFITAGWIGKPGYMSWAQLRELHSLGHKVECHGWSHALLTHCSSPELSDELVRSKGELQERLGIAVSAISMPGGRWNQRVLEACAEAGYKRVYTSHPWATPNNLLCLELTGRWMVTRSTNEKQLRAILTGTGVVMDILRTRYILKETFKAVIGDSAYQRMWRELARKNESAPSSHEKPCSTPGTSA
jgi:hypothetical protein